QMFAALAHVRTLLLQIEHSALVKFRDHTRDVCRPRFLLGGGWSSSVEKPGLLGLTDGEQRAAIATMRQLRRKRWRGLICRSDSTDVRDGVLRFPTQCLI